MRKAVNIRTTQHRGSFSQYVHHLSVEKGLSPRDIEQRLQGQASYSLIAGLAAGDYENVRWETLRALAKGLGVAEERLFAVAIGAMSEDFLESDFLILHEKYLDLMGAHRAAVDGLLQLLQREIARLQEHQQSASQQPLALDPPPQNGKRLFIKGENLQQYVLRIMKEKRLTLKEVAQRSQQQISKGYLCNLLHRAANPTIAKIKALAVGLGVEPLEIFAVLEVHSFAEQQRFQNSIFAVLYDQYQQLSPESKKELRLLLNIIDREIDRWHMQAIRNATR